MKHHLYRHFNSKGDLLYVGISLSAFNRLAQHRDHSHWFNDIERVELEAHETRCAALAAERRAIETEHPLHNIMHNRQNVVALPDAAPTQADLSRRDLTSRVARFAPVYNIAEAAKALCVGETQVRRWMAEGRLGYVEMLGSGTTPRRRVTGWQLIDFLEYWQATRDATGEGAKKAVA